MKLKLHKPPTKKQSRNGSCTSPTSASTGGTTGNNRAGRSGLEGASSSSSRRDNYSGDSSNNTWTGVGGGVNSSSSSAAGGAGGSGGIGGGSGGGVGIGPSGRTRPECVRRSKSQGTGSHHRYRDRLVRTLAFNSSCPANAKEEETGVASLTNSGPPPPPHFHSGFESVDHYCGPYNGKLMEHTREEQLQQQPATRRSLLLLQHRHQSAYTSFGTNVTWHTHQTILEYLSIFLIQSTFSLTNQTKTTFLFHRQPFLFFQFQSIFRSFFRLFFSFQVEN